jgi:hypothetical protein
MGVIINFLMLLEATHPGSQVEKAVALKFTVEEWLQLMTWLSTVSVITRKNFALNQFLRLGLLLQGSGEEAEPLGAIEGTIRTRGSLTAPPKKVSAKMPASVAQHLRALCQQSGGTNSQVVYACAALLAGQLESIATPEELSVPKRRVARKGSRAA